MKTLLKIIFIGLVAGVTYKYLREKDINLGERFLKIKQWAVEKIGEIEKAAEETQLSGVTENYMAASSYGSIASSDNNQAETEYDEYSGSFGNSSGTGNPSAEDEASAIEFPVLDKYFPGTERFPELDKYALETPDEKAASVQSLADWLSRPALSDLEKARLVYTWVATFVRYDDFGYNTGNYSDTEADAVLRNRVAVCQGYSNLFFALARQAGLEATVITGYAKGISYRPGSRFSSTNHAWNAVKIDGEWKLFDATWGSGYGQGVNGKLVSTKRFDDYWFNTHPGEFIFTHFPQDEYWQFNSPKISLSQYERMPYASSEYFSKGFNGAAVFPEVINGSLKEFPVSYGSEGDIRILSMPSGKYIPQGTAINVRIRSGNALRMAYRNNGKITDMKKEGDVFSAVIYTTPGQLRLMGTFKEGDPSYHIFLDYEVR